MNIKNKIRQNQKDKFVKKQQNKQPKSQFVRNKLEEDYNPKLNQRKHSLHYFKEDLNKKLQKEKLIKQEQNKICSKALESFKKGEQIDIDWKTKTNFRILPKINQSSILPPIQVSHSNDLNKQSKNTFQEFSAQEIIKQVQKNYFSYKVLRSLEKMKSISLKDNNQIKRKISHLNYILKNNNQLMSSRKIKNSFSQQIFSNKKVQQKSQMNDKQKSQIDSSDKIKQISNSNISQRKGKIRYKREENNQDQINFSNLRSLTNNELNRIQQNALSQFMENRSLTQKSLQLSRKIQEFRQGKVNKCSIINNDIEEEDIFQNKQIFHLICKSREKLIDFKHRMQFENLSKLQKLKLVKKRKLIKINQIQKKIIQKNQFDILKIKNNAKINKQQCMFFENQQLQKPESLIFLDKSTIKNQSQKNYNIALSKQKLQEVQIQKNVENQKQWLIKDKSQQKSYKKGKSVIEAQTNIIKNTKLILLKQDLIEKFYEIRSTGNQM